MVIRKEFEIETISPVTICDIEIGNNISTDYGDWEYEKSDIITLGIYSGNKIIILQREKTDKIDIWKSILKKELTNQPVMFSLNINMEKKGINGFIGMNRFFEEIRPFKGKNISKDKIFEYLVKIGQVPKNLVPNDPLNGNSGLVQEKYENKKYEDIILHNKSCLIKEYFIFMNRTFLLNKFKDKIKDGWWNDKFLFGR